MRNIKITIRYDGTNYSGWQFQKNGASIQETIEKALKAITGEKVHVTGSGRTDAGVHAKAQVANFRTRSKLPLKRLQMALNSAFPDDIVVTRIKEAGPKFNAQHSARSKLYCYTIVNNDFNDPFLRNFAAKSFYKLDLSLMRKAAKILIGRHDFKAFQTKDGEKDKNSVRTIKKIRIEKRDDVVTFYIEANGFLYNMARNIVGTLIEAGRGKFSLAYVREVLAKKDRRLSGPAMPAKGLSLDEVKY